MTDSDLLIIGGSEGASITTENYLEKDGILTFDVRMTLPEDAIPAPFRVRFSIPDVDIYSTWSPSVRFDRSLCPNWLKKKTESRLASWMPLHALVSLGGRNRMTVAVSDAKTPISIGTGVSEETAAVDCELTFFTVKVAPLREYTATVRVDLRDIPYYDSIYAAAAWWEEDCGYTPARVPEAARLPMNSLWYSFHQELDVEEILRECALSKPLGMDTVIIDDGWQTDDSGRGYAYCGDWELATGKIPDMKEFVDRIHETGMKVMLWYSVPYIGVYAKNYPRFKEMILDDTGNKRSYFALDPRYKEVRDFLVGVYTKAVKDWGLDGLKLDFIDSFVLRGRSLEDDPRRDYRSLEDAVDVLMTDVTKALTAINPDILIEFRQSYVGPAIRKYGNMLRVADCPNDALRNRQDVVNLRLTSGNTAVHSDMLMWNYSDPVESAALQLVSVLYSVPQISVRIARLSEAHKKMLAFYLAFWREHRDVLLDGKLLPKHPENAYSSVIAERDGRAIVTAYSDPTVECGAYREIIAINACGSGDLFLRGADGKSYEILSCTGETVGSGTVRGEIAAFAVPLSGMIRIR